jgi:hypothetical protein
MNEAAHRNEGHHPWRCRPRGPVSGKVLAISPPYNWFKLGKLPLSDRGKIKSTLETSMSGNGTLRQFSGTQQFGRLRSETDIRGPRLRNRIDAYVPWMSPRTDRGAPHRQRRCSQSHCSGRSRTQLSTTEVIACIVASTSIWPLLSRGGSSASVISAQKRPAGRRMARMP